MERLLLKAQETAYRFSLLVCGHVEDAEDVMQDALLRTYQHVTQITDPEAFRPWLYTTVRNACLMKRRRRSGEPSHFVSIEQGGTPDDGAATAVEIAGDSRPADQQIMDAWIDRRLQAALRALPPSYRAIVVLREVEGLPTREVSTITGLSEANVKTRLHRAREIIRRLLDGHARTRSGPRAPTAQPNAPAAWKATPR